MKAIFPVFRSMISVRRGANLVPRRTFIQDLLSSAMASERKKFSEQRVLGYSPEQVHNVVSNVADYSLFLPWCLDSRVLKRFSPERFNAKLVVGFPPLTENYISEVQTAGTHYLKSVCRDGLLFNHLIAEWHFEDGPSYPQGPTCLLKFFVDFKFKSGLHSALANIFFNEVVKTMARSFERRCCTVYGPDFLKLSSAKKHRPSEYKNNHSHSSSNDVQ